MNDKKNDEKKKNNKKESHKAKYGINSITEMHYINLGEILDLREKSEKKTKSNTERNDDDD